MAEKMKTDAPSMVVRRFAVGEAETHGKGDPRGSDDITSDNPTERNFTLPIDRIIAAAVQT